MDSFLASVEPLFLCDASIIFMGDFNFPDIKWCPNDLLPIQCSSGCSSVLIDFLSRHALLQYVLDPTRLSNILDLVFCNDAFAIIDLNVVPPFSNSDHNGITFNLFLTDEVLPLRREVNMKHNFKKANWDGVISQISCINWQELFSDLPYNKWWDVFQKQLTKVVNMNVPVSGFDRTKRNIKYPKHIRILQIRKLAIWKCLQKSRNETIAAKYLDISKQCRNAIYEHAVAKESALLDSNNLGQFYKYVNKKLATKSSIGVLKDKNGENVYDPVGQTDIVSNFFASTFTTDDGILPEFPSRVPLDVSLSYVPFDQESVLAALNKLRPGTAGGPDGLQPCLLKKVAGYIALPLSMMFETFFLHAYVPPIWKLAYVRPVMKSGSVCLASNYRPISLTCTCSKLMESIVSKHMLDYMLKNGLISDQQHGFIAKRSACLQLLESFQDWILELSDRKSIDVIYLDFSKAFDSVSHNKLLHKLHSYGFCYELCMSACMSMSV